MRKKNVTIAGVRYALERGRVARVYYCPRSSPCGAGKPFRFWRIVSGKKKSTWHALGDLAAISAQAREMNAGAAAVGERYAIPTSDEANALRMWREFCVRRRAGEWRHAASLSSVLEGFLGRVAAGDETPRISEAAANFFEEKARNGFAGAGYLATAKTYVGFFSEALGDCRLGEVSAEAVEAALSRGKAEIGVRSRRAYLQALKSLFGWWFSRENSRRRVADQLANPLASLALPRIKKTREPEIISPEVLRRVLESVAGFAPRLLAVCVVQAFCGVRLAEALRLQWSDFREGVGESGGYVFLSAAVTKTQVARVAPVPECAAAWLALCPRKGGAGLIAGGEISPANFAAARRQVLRKRAGLALPKNALRHSAASYLSAVYGNAKAADICGHDVRTAGVYYRAATTPEIARAWFSVFPRGHDIDAGAGQNGVAGTETGK